MEDIDDTKTFYHKVNYVNNWRFMEFLLSFQIHKIFNNDFFMIINKIIKKIV